MRHCLCAGRGLRILASKCLSATRRLIDEIRRCGQECPLSMNPTERAGRASVLDHLDEARRLRHWTRMPDLDLPLKGGSAVAYGAARAHVLRSAPHLRRAPTPTASASAKNSRDAGLQNLPSVTIGRASGTLKIACGNRRRRRWRTSGAWPQSGRRLGLLGVVLRHCPAWKRRPS